MNHIQLFEDFLNEGAASNLELKSIARKLYDFLKKSGIKAQILNEDDPNNIKRVGDKWGALIKISGDKLNINGLGDEAENQKYLNIITKSFPTLVGKIHGDDKKAMWMTIQEK